MIGGATGTDKCEMTQCHQQLKEKNANKVIAHALLTVYTHKQRRDRHEGVRLHDSYCTVPKMATADTLLTDYAHKQRRDRHACAGVSLHISCGAQQATLHTGYRHDGGREQYAR